VSGSPEVPTASKAPAYRGKREVFRLVPPVVLWWLWLAFAIVNITDAAVQGSARFAEVLTAVIVTVTGVVYACALRPRVIADDAGLRVQNPLRDHIVPWGNVVGVEVTDWVQIRYDPGPGAAPGTALRTVDSWALFAPARSLLRAQVRARDPAVRARARRLPEDAKGLVSLSPAQAIAKRLDDRAAAERRAGAAARPAAVRWAWPALAAIAVPALALIVVVFI
jgi:hypothetical protein